MYQPYKNYKAVDFVELAFGGKYKPVFLIDNSPIHKYENYKALVDLNLMVILQGVGWWCIERQDYECQRYE